ncbi:MAG: hypothetical protein DMG13_33630, partial [Acidobacteria bacterium]
MQTTVADAVSGPQAEAEHPSIKVLLIEDNPLDVRLIGIMLRDSAPGLFQLEQVERLETGLRRLAQGGIDLVLVDLSLPDSHGLETFSRVHAQARNVPII